MCVHNMLGHGLLAMVLHIRAVERKVVDDCSTSAGTMVARLDRFYRALLDPAHDGA